MLALSRFFCVNFGRGPDWPDVTGGVWGPGCGLDEHLDDRSKEFKLLGSPKQGNSP